MSDKTIFGLRPLDLKERLYPCGHCSLKKSRALLSTSNSSPSETLVHHFVLSNSLHLFQLPKTELAQCLPIPPANGGEYMKKGIGAFFALALIFIATGATAHAQYRNDDRYRRDRYEDRDWRRNRDRDDRYRNGNYNNYDFNQGYQYGLNTGSSDAQRRQSYNPQRSRYYRNASSQGFRNGFVRGYNEGYRRYAGYNGGYGGYGGYGNSQELNRGYQQGLDTGSSDARRGQSYSPERSKYYRNASSQAFREGFVRGYDEGYRRYNGSYRQGGYGGNVGGILGTILGLP
jgi:hypothetical protein